jgi:hypothetical protein
MSLIKLSWYKTGDEFQLQCPDFEFAGWFVDQCHRYGNNFGISNLIHDKSSIFIDDYISALKKCIESTNLFLKKIKWPLIEIPSEFENQAVLNSLHKQWVMIHRRQPDLDKLMYKIDPGLFDDFHNINRLIHTIENSFTYHLRESSLWRTDNPFSISQDFNRYHLSISYNDFGKSSFEKWQTDDNDPNDEELSNWRTIGSSVCFDLFSGHHGNVPQKSYIDYCQLHKIDMVTEFWPLGNIHQPEQNLSKVRHLCNRNFQITHNPLQFNLL